MRLDVMVAVGAAAADAATAAATAVAVVAAFVVQAVRSWLSQHSCRVPHEPHKHDCH